MVRKVERQYLDTIAAAGMEYEELQVDGTSIEAYMRNWAWDFARYQHQGKKLNELVAQILSMAAQMEEELKKLTTAHAEKTQAMSALDRKKNINLSTSDFEDFLTPEQLSRFEVLDNEHLQTVFVAMPRAVEAEFLKEYVNLGLSIGQTFNGEKLCVVVPESAKLVLASGDQVMYLMTVIKGKYEAGYYDHAEPTTEAVPNPETRRRGLSASFVPGKAIDFVAPLQHKFREKRMVLRTFSYDEKKTGGVEGQLDKIKRDVADSAINMVRWCKATFSMLFPGLIHLKVISCFAESVLRYGVPVNFLAVFLDPNLKREKDLKKALLDTITNLRPELKDHRGKINDEEGLFTEHHVFTYHFTLANLKY
jgi:V-type H+-transporting ATPase subunit C